jgi:hypothetical protein
MIECPKEVQLTMQEVATAAVNGVWRRISAMGHNRPNDQKYDGKNAWQIDVEGALAEMALAKALKLYWTGAAKIRAVDVGDSHEARHTQLEVGSLIVYEKDKPDYLYWLVIGVHGKYTIHGWMTGKEAQQDKYWRKEGVRSPAFFVPQGELHGRVEKKGSLL